MNITTEELVQKLQLMLDEIGENTLYGKRVKCVINSLQEERYQDLSNILPSDDLISELQKAGFYDLTKQLTMKGGFRFNGR